tara:strand:- start:41 stop:211 length:171 start_codon:yes stop_codon:yes gene_type:complete
MIKNFLNFFSNKNSKKNENMNITIGILLPENTIEKKIIKNNNEKIINRYFILIFSL